MLTLDYIAYNLYIYVYIFLTYVPSIKIEGTHVFGRGIGEYKKEEVNEVIYCINV